MFSPSTGPLAISGPGFRVSGQLIQSLRCSVRREKDGGTRVEMRVEVTSRRGDTSASSLPAVNRRGTPDGRRDPPPHRAAPPRSSVKAA